MKLNSVITHTPSAARPTLRPMSKVKISALRNATEAINIICELNSLEASPHFGKSRELMVNFYLKLRTLKKRFVSLMQSGELSNSGFVPQSVFDLDDQVWDVWTWLKENHHESNKNFSLFDRYGIPMTYEDVLEKHSATIKMHREIIRSNKNYVPIEAPEDVVYLCFSEYVFVTLYGCFPDADDSLLGSCEFDDIEDDCRLVMGFDPRGDF